MFCKSITRITAVFHRHFSNLNLSKKVGKERWDLVSSVCLERKPTITKDLTDIEQSYSSLMEDIELEMSYKSDHEIRKLKDQLFAEELKKKNSLVDSDQVSLQTAQEFEDLCLQELNAFNFAERTTDNECNYTNTSRKLSHPLLLITKQTVGAKPIWVLPQGTRNDGETMRQAAERVLKEVCGNDLQVRFFGNAPCGFYKFRYPKSAQTSSIGMKIFFFKAQLVDGNVSHDICKDFKWLAPTELEVGLDLLPEDYLKTIKTFLVENE